MGGFHFRALVACGIVSLGCSSDPSSDSAGAGGAGLSAGASGHAASGDSFGGAAAGTAGSGGTAGNGNGNGGNSSSSGTGGTVANPKQGQIVFSQLFNSGASARPGLAASFSNSWAAIAPGCEVFDADGCKVTVCDDAPAVVPAASPSVGTITVTSPDVAGSAVLKPAADGSYSSPKIAFDGGFGGQETLIFSAPGAEVPPVNEELLLPLALLRSKPFVDNSSYHSTVLVPRSADLELEWTRGAPNVLMLVIGSSPRADGNPGTAALYCEFASAPGAAVVRRSLLERLEVTASLRTLSVGTKTITAGAYNVRLATVFEVYDATKTFPVTDTIQLYDP